MIRAGSLQIGKSGTLGMGVNFRTVAIQLLALNTFPPFT